MKEMWCRNLASKKENFFFKKKTGSSTWTRNTGEGNVNFPEAKEDSEQKCSGLAYRIVRELHDFFPKLDKAGLSNLYESEL